MVNRKNKYSALILAVIFGVLSSTQTFWHFHAVGIPSDHLTVSGKVSGHTVSFNEEFCLIHHTFSTGLTVSFDLISPDIQIQPVLPAKNQTEIRYFSDSVPQRGPPVSLI
ncbi:MAG: hypothetical protein L6Q77_05720 [Bacteroidetes bacterium]|nr:hypothetical protein [Bacteroidota bacterium]